MTAGSEIEAVAATRVAHNGLAGLGAGWCKLGISAAGGTESPLSSSSLARRLCTVEASLLVLGEKACASSRTSGEGSTPESRVQRGEASDGRQSSMIISQAGRELGVSEFVVRGHRREGNRETELQERLWDASVISSSTLVLQDLVFSGCFLQINTLPRTVAYSSRLPHVISKRFQGVKPSQKSPRVSGACNRAKCAPCEMSLMPQVRCQVAISYCSHQQRRRQQVWRRHGGNSNHSITRQFRHLAVLQHRTQRNASNETQPWPTS